MLVRWVATVRREMNMRSAICGLDRPSATALATRSSVGVRAAQPVAGRWRLPRPRLAYAAASSRVMSSPAAGPVLEATDRCEVISGDFFAGVPDGADRYLLANVLHDWDDDRAVAILAECRKAMAKDGRVLIVERLIPDDPEQALPTLLSDLNMLIVTGGKERTNAEYASLLTRAGLALDRVTPVSFPYGVIGTGSPSRQRRGDSDGKLARIGQL